MSKGVKKVLGFVVAVAIPFVALPLAGMLAASTGIAALGGWVGSAAVGAGLGAANAALTGGNVGQGALFGGIGGGLAGAAGGASAFAGAPKAGLPGLPADAAAYPAGTVATPGAPVVTPGVDVAAMGGAAYPTLPAATTAPTTATATTFMEAVGQIPSTIGQALTDPTKLADITLRAGSMLVSGMMTEDPMEGIPEEERRLVEMRMQELQAIQRTDQQLFDRQLKLATDVMNEAKQYNPQYFAQQAAKDQQLRGAAEEKRMTETYNIGAGQTGREAALNAEQRRIGLSTGRAMGSAFTSGLQNAQATRNQGIASAAGLFPTTSPRGAYGSMLDLYGKYSDRAAQQQAGLQQTLGDFTTTLFPPTAKPKPKTSDSRKLAMDVASMWGTDAASRG